MCSRVSQDNLESIGTVRSKEFLAWTLKCMSTDAVALDGIKVHIPIDLAFGAPTPMAQAAGPNQDRDRAAQVRA